MVPKDWPNFSPSNIHPEFAGWFREAYEKARGTLPEDQRRDHDGHRRGLAGSSWHAAVIAIVESPPSSIFSLARPGVIHAPLAHVIPSTFIAAVN